MLGLARKFQDYAHAVRTYPALIAEEKRRIDAGMVILPDEFFLNAVEPFLRDNQSPMARFFRERGSAVYHVVTDMADFVGVTTYPLHYDELSEDMQIYYAMRDNQRRLCEVGAAPEPDWRLVSPLDRHLDALPGVRKAWRHAMNRQIEEYPDCDKRIYRAVSLHDMALIANGTTVGFDGAGDIIYSGFSSGGRELERAEFKAIYRGGGRKVLDFWRDVSNLKDYSGFFPHKPRPKGNDRPPKPEFSFAGIGLRPVWGV